MENKIILTFTNSISRLAGNALGRQIYETQVKSNINYSEMNIIVMPATIEDVAISFVQGFTQEIFNKIQKDEFGKYFKVEGNQKVVDKFMKSVYF